MDDVKGLEAAYNSRNTDYVHNTILYMSSAHSINDALVDFTIGFGASTRVGCLWHAHLLIRLFLDQRMYYVYMRCVPIRMTVHGTRYALQEHAPKYGSE